MRTGYVLYNPKAGPQNNAEDLKRLESAVNGAELRFIDILQIKDYSEFLSGLEEDDFIILSGGDGTLNRFVNDMEGIDFNNDILYFPISRKRISGIPKWLRF